MIKKFAGIGLGLTLFSSTPTKSTTDFNIDKPNALRAIGIGSALAGLYLMAKKDSVVRGPILIAAGLAATLGSERIVDWANAQLKQGTFTRWLRNLKNDCKSTSEELDK